MPKFIEDWFYNNTLFIKWLQTENAMLLQKVENLEKQNEWLTKKLFDLGSNSNIDSYK